MSYSINSITDDCYEGTTCLVNKFGIKNEKQLSEIEADITFAKTSKLEEIPLKGNIVDLYCTLNILHPYREGNGRTERIFISQLIRFNGYDIDFSDIDTDYLMFATIQSARGITDNLLNLFKENII